MGVKITLFSLVLLIAICSVSAISTDPTTTMVDTTFSSTFDSIQDIIGTDAGDRGMKPLIVPGDLEQAASIVASLPPKSVVIVLSGFPCCVTQTPPSETDGPPEPLQ